MRATNDIATSRSVRRYIGVVAESVYAVDDTLRMRGRTKDLSRHPSHDLVQVEGNLRVQGDGRLLDGKLDFRDAAGTDQGTPLTVSRKDATNAHSLQVTIGQAAGGNNRFVVGPLQAGVVDAKLVVLDNGNVGVGTSGPGAKLEIKDGDLLFKAVAEDAGDIIFQNSAATQKGKIWSNPSPGAALFLSSGDNTPDVAIDANGKVGVGTTTPRNSLGVRATGPSEELISFENPAGQTKWHINQNFQNTAALNFVETGVADARLFLKAGGNVGIGTTNPRTRLEVDGDVRLDAGGALLAAGGLESLRILRGSVQSNSTIASGAGFSVGKPATGLYVITFNQAFTSAPSASVTQVFPDFASFGAGGDTRDNAVIVGINAQQMKVKTGANNGAASDRDFTFLVIGPR